MAAMDGLWRWDIDAFRAIHLGLRSVIPTPLLQIITDMGLFHVQAMALLVVWMRPRVPAWALAAAILAAAAISYFGESRGLHALTAFGLCTIIFWNVPAKIAIAAFAASGVAGILRIAVEATVNRQRPSNLDFAQPIEAVFGHSSFPSGHATTTMAIALFLLWALEDKDRPLGWIALGWAILVGISRIGAGVHYPLDVIAGFALALAASTGFWLYWRSRDDKKAADSAEPPI